MQLIAKRLFCIVYLLLICGPLLAQPVQPNRPKIPGLTGGNSPSDSGVSKVLIPVGVPPSIGQPPGVPRSVEDMKKTMQIQDPKMELKSLGGKIQKKLMDLNEEDLKSHQGGQDVSGTKSDINGGEILEAEYLFLAKSLWDRARIQREAMEARGFIDAEQFLAISKILDTNQHDHVHVFALKDSSLPKSCLPFSIYVDVKAWSKEDDFGKEKIILRDLSKLITRMGLPELSVRQQELIVNFVSASEDVIHRYDPVAGSVLNGRGFIRAMADGNPQKHVQLKIKKDGDLMQLVVRDESTGREKIYSSNPADVIYNPVTCEPDRFPERQGIRYTKKASDLLDTSFFYGSMFSQAKYCTDFLQQNYKGNDLDIESLWVLERGSRVLFCISFYRVGVRK